MINPRHFLRMSRWARNPPSKKRVKLVITIVLICALIFLIERYIGWPGALATNSFKLRG
ncbi:MAG: hypothetical protein P8P65_07300 [Planktotalea sp.]|uniref:hypothetical protein n=1 Tax=Planktotalea sp. TaxID=2029877 RepID=UPI002636AE18|nr:hypothetical protein [Planktotalea sp.]MDG1076445.1 hypothetical protein [Planktotalea sp.]MDG1082727.1 hypothetical protein [Planktotalea sp.]